jgi:heme-degrading monooxygenase HmoA
MFSVIFEVCPGPGKKDVYLELAKHLKPMLESMQGFIDNERFESQSRQGWVLSHSTWRDEKSLVRWRTQAEHHVVQEQGRFEVFDDYHLRVGEVTFDSAPPKNITVKEQRFEETDVGAAKVAIFTEVLPTEKTGVQAELLLERLALNPNTHGLVSQEVWASIYNPGKLALLTTWSSFQAAASWMPAATGREASVRHRRIRIVRDYGRFDRREAPQDFAEVRRGNAPQ